MPEISRFYGIVITMYFPDHNPPHFHVRYNDYHAIIDIETGKVKGEMPRQALSLVFQPKSVIRPTFQSNSLFYVCL